MKLRPIEPTWHGGPLLTTREDYLCALIDELLVEVSRDESNLRAFHDPAPLTPRGGYISGKTHVPDHPVERAMRALAWQMKNRPNAAKRLTATVSAALEKRGLI